MPLNSLPPSNFSEFGLQELTDILFEDYSIDNREIEECREIPHSNHQRSDPQVMMAMDDNAEGESSGNAKRRGRKEKIGRIAFITKSDIDKLDDGYKWRKYGRKKVKDSPNPRCTSGGCNVKKRIERMREDSSYVLTTYEGIHSHHAPYTETTQPGAMAASSVMAALNGLNC
ncbi:probable WRKY transcription factor 75 [Phalaenopsis equestris]|uniref:probable WRKY transcription factor 75 n=1 Tax=Phalaenopsis equestris TaxID=78828 RepID=UPI0009E4DEA8|nr:probable WRKY transcription factor 75 [Phalaenopsis equestris]